MYSNIRQCHLFLDGYHFKLEVVPLITKHSPMSIVLSSQFFFFCLKFALVCTLVLKFFPPFASL